MASKTHPEHHEHLIKEVSLMLKPVLSKSPQAIYVYLDDAHKICNEKFAKMLGYKTVNEWVKNEYPLDDILEKEQPKAIKAYMNASEGYEASSISLTLVKKNKRTIKANVIMTPFIYKDEVFVLHFISPKK